MIFACLRPGESDLTKRLLAFSRNNPLSTRHDDLNRVCYECLEIVRRIFSEDIHFQFKSSERPLIVSVDASQIEQVILNLCLNSRDAMESGGEINISCGEVTLKRDHKEYGLSVPAGSYATLEVSDTGHGLTDHNLYQIFEPFYTSKPVGQGTGLGLSIVYGVVQQHQGAIQIETSSSGTIFRILLPLESPLITSEEIPVVESPGNTSFECSRILVVEDEPSIRKAIADALNDEGLEVLVAPDGRSAIEIIDQSVADLDALVSDVVMPGVGGKEVCSAFREKYPEGEIVLISGHGDSVLSSEFLMRYQATFLPKPFTVSSLIKLLSPNASRER